MVSRLRESNEAMKVLTGATALIALLLVCGCSDPKPAGNTASTSAATASAGDGVTASAPTDGVKDAIKAGTAAADATVPLPPNDEKEMANLKAAMGDEPSGDGASKKK